MSLLVTGSIGIDSVITPHGAAEAVLGGTCVYFSFAASYYTPVRLVGVVGDDFPDEFRAILGTRQIWPGSKLAPAARRFAGRGTTSGT